MRSEIEQFEVDVHEVVAFEHDCDCEHCQERRRRDRWRLVTIWLLLTRDEQREWIADHANGELSETLQRALIESAEAGRDVVALHDEFERRRPKEDT